ncbi:MAG: hypothetical protein KatS3mg031_0185 [Chitinophagales bacterium]|nr:MAG: hypothetical protein KatS3mg031_0185 [Chitinophagales bacterium]
MGKLPNFDPMNYQDARRYLENAKRILKEQAKPVNGNYSDRKYVRMAGDTAWKGVLIAAGNWLNAKGLKWDKRTRPDVNWFEQQIARRNKKMLSHFLNAYDILHCSMGYDGTLSINISKEGLAQAEAFIRLCENDS